MNATLLGCAVGVLLLSGCSLGKDPEGWPPSLVELRAELGTPARGTMRVKDFDKGTTYDSPATFLVSIIGNHCILDIYFEEKDYEYYTLRFYGPDGCDLDQKLTRNPYAYSSLYMGETSDGQFRLDNDSTISGVFHAGMVSNGLVGGRRRLAGTFVARRIASLE